MAQDSSSSVPSRPTMGFRAKTMIREWIVFALCLGLGAHVALGVLLHGSFGWPTETYGFYGIAFGVGIYVVVQVSRFVWRLIRGKRDARDFSH
jgi:hypothetical protein